MRLFSDILAVMSSVTMMCMTTKQKFEVENPQVVVLRNGRFAYKEKCPWQGKNGKELYAFKFCSQEAYTAYQKQKEGATEDSDES
jgi:hypothetical protein